MQPGLISLDRLGKIQSNSVCNILRPTLLIIIWVMLLSSCGDSSSSPSLTPQADSGPIKASTKTALAPNHREILAQKERLTKAQWTQYVESILGTQVRNWYGVVSNVTQQDNTYLVEVERGTGGSVEVYFELAQEEAINLNKDQKITFSGTISEIAGDQTSLSTSLFCEVYHCAIKLENVTWVLGYVPPAVAPTYDEIMTQKQSENYQ